MTWPSAARAWALRSAPASVGLLAAARWRCHLALAMGEPLAAL